MTWLEVKKARLINTAVEWAKSVHSHDDDYEECALCRELHAAVRAYLKADMQERAIIPMEEDQA